MGEQVMVDKLSKYGVTGPLARPHIKATKKLSLEGPKGRQLVLLEAKKQLRIYQKTFARLASV